MIPLISNLEERTLEYNVKESFIMLKCFYHFQSGFSCKCSSNKLCSIGKTIHIESLQVIYSYSKSYIQQKLMNKMVEYHCKISCIFQLWLCHFQNGKVCQSRWQNGGDMITAVKWAKCYLIAVYHKHKMLQRQN